jgi:hypothetical protein
MVSALGHVSGTSEAALIGSHDDFNETATPTLQRSA